MTESSVTDAGVSALRNCRNLVELGLIRTVVTNNSLLECFPKLSILDLQSSTYIKDFRPLSKALKLSKLYLRRTNFSDLGILASLPLLRDLLCGISKVTRLKPPSRS